METPPTVGALMTLFPYFEVPYYIQTFCYFYPLPVSPPAATIYGSGGRQNGNQKHDETFQEHIFFQFEEAKATGAG